MPLVVVTLGMEALLYSPRSTTASPSRARERPRSRTPTFIGFFALMHFVFLQAEVMRQRREHRSTLAREHPHAARGGARLPPDLVVAVRRSQDALAREPTKSASPSARSRPSTRRSIYTLDLLKKSLDLHTCVLLWLDDTGERLKIKELVTDSDCIVETAIPPTPARSAPSSRIACS